MTITGRPLADSAAILAVHRKKIVSRIIFLKQNCELLCVVNVVCYKACCLVALFDSVEPDFSGSRPNSSVGKYTAKPDFKPHLLSGRLK
jgi:hypothetical protein